METDACFGPNSKHSNKLKNTTLVEAQFAFSTGVYIMRLENAFNRKTMQVYLLLY